MDRHPTKKNGQARIQNHIDKYDESIENTDTRISEMSGHLIKKVFKQSSTTPFLPLMSFEPGQITWWSVGQQSRWGWLKSMLGTKMEKSCGPFLVIISRYVFRVSQNKWTLDFYIMHLSLQMLWKISNHVDLGKLSKYTENTWKHDPFAFLLPHSTSSF